MINNEYVTGEEILASNQRQTIEQAKFTFFPLGKKRSKNNDYGDLIFFVNGNILETNFSESKSPVVFLDSIKNLKYWWKKHDINKKHLTDI